MHGHSQCELQKHVCLSARARVQTRVPSKRAQHVASAPRHGHFPATRNPQRRHSRPDPMSPTPAADTPDTDDFDETRAFGEADSLLSARSTAAAPPAADRIERARCKWLALAVSSGKRIVPDSTHACTPRCGFELMAHEDDASAPLFVCTATGAVHACGEQCDACPSCDPETSTFSCPLTGMQMDVLHLGANFNVEVRASAAGRSKVFRCEARNTARHSALQRAFDAAESEVGVRDGSGTPRLVGLATTAWANAQLCSAGDGSSNVRGAQATYRRRATHTSTAALSRERVGAVQRAAGCTLTNHGTACAVLMRLLFSKRRAEYEDRKYACWHNETRKLLQRYRETCAGKFRCLGTMLTLHRSSLKRPPIDGMYVTTSDMRRMVSSYGTSFHEFIEHMNRLANKTAFSRVTPEHVVAWLYMLREGVAHNGEFLVQQDANMFAWLPEVSALDVFGFSKSAFTSCRKVYWRILHDAIQKGARTRDLCMQPVEIVSGAGSADTIYK